MANCEGDEKEGETGNNSPGRVHPHRGLWPLRLSASPSLSSSPALSAAIKKQKNTGSRVPPLLPKTRRQKLPSLPPERKAATRGKAHRALSCPRKISNARCHCRH